jgi:hypothetical protein
MSAFCKQYDESVTKSPGLTNHLQQFDKFNRCVSVIPMNARAPATMLNGRFWWPYFGNNPAKFLIVYAPNQIADFHA